MGCCRSTSRATLGQDLIYELKYIYAIRKNCNTDDITDRMLAREMASLYMKILLKNSI